ncbi:MAG: glycoside hydrolase family 10 protein [Cetobacterium sp.]|uniref:glycoside hydrolase family 10 protein n=1 Tax=Cetobacterium sp. TaxID=2071632 RepID=UPI003EE7F0B3
MNLKNRLKYFYLFILSIPLLAAEMQPLKVFKEIDSKGNITYSDEAVLLDAKSLNQKILIPKTYKTPKNMMRTTWVATVDNLHFPKVVNGKIRNSMDELKSDWIEILNNHEEMNFNTVIFQVSPTLDALYKSKYRPWSHVLTGTQGMAPEWANNFDLIDWMIEETHKRGMEFHAWFNPYRVTHKYIPDTTYEKEMSKLSSDNFAKQNSDLVYMFDQKLYLDAGNTKTIEHVVNTVNEFIETYDVDAIHFDDYFYPYKTTRNGVTLHFGDQLEDEKTFKNNSRGFTDIKKWRQTNNDLMVQAVKQTIDKYNLKNKKSIQWGVSPFGIWEHKNNNPLGSNTPIASTSAKSDIYADTRKWVVEETIDYIIPQVYWEFMQPAAPYGEITSWWDNVAKNSRTHLYIGHADYKHQNAGWAKHWQNPEEIGNQLKFNNMYKNIKGSAFFGYSSLLKMENPENKPGIVAQNAHIDILKNKYFNKKVLVPAKPWLDKQNTENIKNIKVKNSKNEVALTFKDSLKNDSRFYVVYSGDEILKIVGRDKKSENQKIILTSSELKNKKITGVSIKDRAGIETPITKIK